MVKLVENNYKTVEIWQVLEDPEKPDNRNFTKWVVNNKDDEISMTPDGVMVILKGGHRMNFKTGKFILKTL